MKDRKSINDINGLQKSSDAENLDRRNFLTRASAMGLMLGSGFQLLPGTAIANMPRKGGLLRMGLDGGSTTDSLDPLLFIGTPHISQIYHCIYDQLTNIKPGGILEPMLAESWDSNDDSTVWKFSLRKGVTFHDGRPFTAKDVKYSLTYLASESNTRPNAKVTTQSIANIKVEGSHTIVVELKDPDFEFAHALGRQGVLIIPEGTTDFTNPVGTGPYKLESFEPGLRARLKKHVGFWTDKEGHFDEIEIINMADGATRTNAVRNGDVDVVYRPDIATAKRLASVQGIELMLADGGQHYTTAMRLVSSPFENNNVRLAIKHGVRRQEFVDKVLGGFGYPGNDTPIGRNYRFYNDTLPQREYDPDKTRFHWKKSGLGTNPGIVLTASDGAFTGSVASAQLVQASLAEAGINIEVKTVPGDGYWTDVWRNVPWCYCYWNGSPTTGQQLSYYTSSNSYNDAAIKNERFDKLIAEAATQRDESLRQELYFEAQRILHEEGGTTVLGYSSFVHAGSSKLGYDKIGARAPVDDHALARRWWWKS